MKFYCDQCSAKYSIPDEKVRGKVVKVRCKECDHVITVRGSQRDETGTDRASADAEASAGSGGETHSTQWYYSHKGETYGPHQQDELCDQYRNGEIPRASYVWRDGFSDWKPAEDVEPFAGALEEQTSESGQPARKTQGVGGDALEAIEPADEQTGADTGVSDGNQTADDTGAATSAPDARTAGGTDESSRSTDKGTGRAERLERLRNRLQSSFAEDEAETSEVTAEEAAGDQRDSQDDGAAASSESSADETEEVARSAADEIDVEVESNLSRNEGADAGAPGQTGVDVTDRDERTTTEDGLGPSKPAGGVDLGDEPSADDDDFDLPPAGSDRLGEESSDDSPVSGERAAAESTPKADSSPGVDVESHDGLFDAVDEEAASAATGTADATGPETGGDTDIPTTPSLGDDDESASLRDSVSESLLIQIDNIKKTDRSEYVKWGGVAVLLIALLGGAWWYLYNPDAANNLFGGAEREEGRTSIAGNEGGLEFQTYSEDKVLNFGATKVPKNPQETGAETSPSSGSSNQGGGAEQPSGTGESGGSGGSDSETLTGGAESLFAEDGEGLEQALAKSNRQKATAGGESGGSKSGSGGSGSGEQGAVAAQASAGNSDGDGESDPFAGLDEIDSPTAGPSSGGPNIDAPEDNLGKEEEASNLSSQLSKERISRAIRNVSKSVGTCRQRHARHGAPLEANKVTIVFTVQRDGRVSAFQLNPKSLRNSRFEKCLQARKGRWNFGPIPNAPQQMKAPFILQ
jgi:predicted Zn finger-like uncharacterized protein